MDGNFREIWEAYTSSWKAESSEEKQKIFETCLGPNCEYSDPLIKTKSWGELLGYMLEFHKQIPGGTSLQNIFSPTATKVLPDGTCWVATVEFWVRELVLGNTAQREN